MPAPDRLVICGLGGDRGPLELPASVVDDGRGFVSGGERSLYELAVAAASLGVDVELRGQVNRAVLAELTGAAGIAPRTGLSPRRPEADDLVVVPEAVDLDVVAAVHLSAARGVIELLGPPGLCGWDFTGPVATPPDPWTVPFDRLCRPDSFRVMSALGFELWTTTAGIAAAGRRAGVPVTWLGTGTPVPFPDIPDKTHDVAVVEVNRWRDQAEAVAAELPGVSVLRVSAVPHTYSLAAHLAPARILLWPSRVEATSRIAREARSVGTVPLTLDSNPFALADDHTAGAVLAPDLDGMVRAVRALLDDPVHLAERRAVALDSARRQSDWPLFVARVEQALTAGDERGPTGPDPDRDRLVAHTRGQLGAATVEQVGHLRTRAEDVEAHLRHVLDERARTEGEVVADRDGLRHRLAEVDADLERVRTAHGLLGQAVVALTAERDASRTEVVAFRNRRSVRLAEAARRRSRSSQPPDGPGGR